MMMENDEINAFTERLTAMLLEGEDAFIVAMGAKAPTPDCDDASTTVTIKGYVGRKLEEFTGNGAFNIESSARLARMKLRDARASHARSLVKAKADKAA